MRQRARGRDFVCRSMRSGIVGARHTNSCDMKLLSLMRGAFGNPDPGLGFTTAAQNVRAPPSLSKMSASRSAMTRTDQWSYLTPHNYLARYRVLLKFGRRTGARPTLLTRTPRPGAKSLALRLGAKLHPNRPILMILRTYIRRMHGFHVVHIVATCRIGTYHPPFGVQIALRTLPRTSPAPPAPRVKDASGLDTSRNPMHLNKQLILCTFVCSRGYSKAADSLDHPAIQEARLTFWTSSAKSISDSILPPDKACIISLAATVHSDMTAHHLDQSTSTVAASYALSGLRITRKASTVKYHSISEFSRQPSPSPLLQHAFSRSLIDHIPTLHRRRTVLFLKLRCIAPDRNMHQVKESLTPVSNNDRRIPSLRLRSHNGFSHNQAPPPNSDSPPPHSDDDMLQQYTPLSALDKLERIRLSISSRCRSQATRVMMNASEQGDGLFYTHLGQAARLQVNQHPPEAKRTADMGPGALKRCIPGRSAAFGKDNNFSPSTFSDDTGCSATSNTSY
ncbi:uncharacterized protein MYCFIDRAFT_180739 [Pseudocercospora fijiensis CIRAD86]|uniref:Uncharacterized protein n=1 Tax=Pseudocercospora fijiensis (strain CIRAD86) TaxID=383855 RepID=M2ZXF7_PSEFD|nr:uncharacterized protein MYCFIDRAFT_180739 [Pseudocercospora fijiensis CIRAD86]EME76751.1 hypothetical protein MYCFIDRAFT_180739 [Pseudocercospora fijiensis CIRAD86]